jgi:hypothetical protein
LAIFLATTDGTGKAQATSMLTQLVAVADSANVSQEGKLNILGVFEVMWAAEVPVTHPMMWFVAKVRLTPADAGPHKLILRLIDEDGNMIAAPLTADLTIPQIDPSKGAAIMPIVLQVGNATFRSFGTYTFELRVDEAMLAEAELEVRKIPAPAMEG